MDAASTERIRNQVEQCPSGALSYFMNNQKTEMMDEKKIQINISDDGPILIKGPASITYKGKEEVRESKTIALCRCGASANKPYCDGSHRKVDFQG
jgi:hypothetical protein